jgi:hypothetical protein
MRASFTEAKISFKALKSEEICDTGSVRRYERDLEGQRGASAKAKDPVTLSLLALGGVGGLLRVDLTWAFFSGGWKCRLSQSSKKAGLSGSSIQTEN